MRDNLNCILPAALLLLTANAVAAPALKLSNLTLGKNLQTYTTIVLSDPAPPGGLEITITSSDPQRLLIAKAPDEAGSASIKLPVKERFRESPDFWLQATADSGEVEYQASAPGYETGKGAATLAKSGVVMVGPFGEGVSEFTTTPRGWPVKLTLHTVRLDAEGKHVESQLVRGGSRVQVQIDSSDPAVGRVSESAFIEAASDTAVTHFKAAEAGKATLTLKTPPGFAAARLNTLTGTVKAPGIAVAHDMTVGENLQVAVALSLGEPAPEGGVDVILTSESPDKMLLATQPTEVGKPEIKIHMAAGAVNTTYYIQSLAREGTASHVAAAPGYQARKGTIALAPSGVILSLEKHGPPDEAEVFRPESAGSHRNLFVAVLSEKKPTPLALYTAFLDPVTRRSADITVQQLRAGVSLSVDLKNANPEIAALEPRVMIQGGSERTIVPFHPRKVGETVITVGTPKGFSQPSNSTELLAIVRE